jgi:hypothetical protein
VPDGIDRLQGCTFRLTVPEYSKRFDGSKQLIGISVTLWYVRQVFVRQIDLWKCRCAPVDRPRDKTPSQEWLCVSGHGPRKAVAHRP